MRLKGTIASKGIIIAKAFLFQEEMIYIPNHEVLDAQKEVEKLEKSLLKSIEEITKIKHISKGFLDEEKLQIFDAHIEMVKDPVIINEVKEIIFNKHKNAAFAYDFVISKYKKIFEEMDESYIKERLADIKDISKRVLYNLLGLNARDLSLLDYEAIVISTEIAPTEIPLINKNFVKGIISESGGVTSHSSIMARFLNIPSLVGVSNILSSIKDGDIIILDAIHGEVIINPEKQEMEEYLNFKREYENRKETLNKYKHLPTKTKDGYDLQIYANISSPDEIKYVQEYNADGVGLFRSEFLFLYKDELPTLDEQFEAYSKVLSTLREQKVVIRTLDIGGDKILKSQQNHTEHNPALGERAIRFSLNHIDIFKTQLKAMLMANKYGNLHIMFPMISTLDEVIKIKEILQQCEAELFVQDIIPSYYKFGIMVEVPSVALDIDTYLPHVDFVSIGTNDLIQYTMAADRTNELVTHLYQPANSAILKLIKMVIDSCKKDNIPVSMCGEMASDVDLVETLIKLGLTEFSMAPTSILEIRHEISKIKKHG